MSSENSVQISLEVQDNASTQIQNVANKAGEANTKLTALERTLKAISDIEIKFKGFDESKLEVINRRIGKMSDPIKLNIDSSSLNGLTTSIDNLGRKFDEFGKNYSKVMVESEKQITATMKSENKIREIEAAASAKIRVEQAKQAEKEIAKIAKETNAQLQTSILDISRKEIMVSLNINTKLAENKIVELSRTITKELSKSVSDAAYSNRDLNKMATERPIVQQTRQNDGVNYREWEKELQGYLNAKEQINKHYNELGEIHLKYMRDEKARKDKELADQRTFMTVYNNDLKSNMDREVAAWRAQQQELKRLAEEKKRIYEQSMTGIMSASVSNRTPTSSMTARMGGIESQRATAYLSDSARMDAEIRRQEQDNLAFQQRRLMQESRQTSSPQQISVINELTNSLNKLQQTLMMVGVAMSGRQIMEYADNWIHFTNAVGIATEKTGGAAAIQERLFKLAQDNRAPLESITSIYLRMSRAAETLNMTQGQTVQMIDTVTKSLAIMGTSPNAVRGGLLQLEQALGGVTVRGQEFKSILDSMPKVMELVVKNYDAAAKNIKLEEAAMRGASQAEMEKIKSEEGHIKTLADLRNAMYAGKISSEAFSQALLLGQKEVDEIFAKTHKTFAQAFTVIENGFTKWIGKLNETSRASDEFFKISAKIADNFNLIAKALAGLGAGFATYALVAGGFFLAITNPIAFAVSSIVGLGVAFNNLKDDMKIGNSLTTWGDVFDVLVERLSSKIETVKNLFTGLKEFIDNLQPKTESSNQGSQIQAMLLGKNILTGYGDGILADAQAKAASRVVLPKMSVIPQTPSYPQLGLQPNTMSLRPQIDISGAGQTNFMKATLGAEAYDNMIAKITKARDMEKDFQSTVQNTVELNTRRANEEARIAALSEKERFVMKEYYKDLQANLSTFKVGQTSQFKNIEELLDFTKAKGIDMLAPVRDAYEKAFDNKKAQETIEKNAKQLEETIKSVTSKIEPDNAWLEQMTEKLSKTVEIQSIKNPVKLSVTMDTNRFSDKVKELQPIIDKAALKYNVPSNIIAAMIQKESEGNNVRTTYVDPKTGKRGTAAGVMQITKATAETFGVKDVYDQEESIMKAVAALSQRAAKVGLHNAIAAHNQGMGAISLGQGYAKDVERIAGQSTNQVTQTKELVTVNSKLLEIKAAFKERDDALVSNDGKRIEAAQNRVELLKQQGKYSYDNFVKENEANQARITANKVDLENMLKQNRALYDSEKGYERLMTRINESVSAKINVREDGGYEIPTLKSDIKAMFDTEKQLGENKSGLLKVFQEMSALYPTLIDGSIEQKVIGEQVLATDLQIKAVDEERDAINKRITDKSRLLEQSLLVQASVLGDLNKENDRLEKSLTTSPIELRKQAEVKKAGGKDEQAIRDTIDLQENLKMLGSIKDSVVGTLGSSFTNMFTDVLAKGKSFTDAFRDMFKNLVSSISSSLMNIGMNAMMSGNFVAGGIAMVGGMAISLLQSVFKGKTVDTSTPESNVTGSVKGSSQGSDSLGKINDTLYNIHAKEYKALLEITDGFKNLTRAVDNTINLATSGYSWKGSTKQMSGNQPNYNVNPAGSAGMIAGGLAASTGLGAMGVGASVLGGVANGLIGVGATTAGAAVGGVATGITGAALSTGLAVGASSTSAIAIGGAVLGLAGGVIFAALSYGLGKLLGIGKTKYEVIGSGIVSGITEFVLGGAEKQVQVFDYSKIKATTKGWFSDDVQIYDVINRQNPQMTKAISSVFNNFNSQLAKSVQGLGIADLVDTMFSVPKIKLNLKKLKPEEISKKITESLNTTMDNIVSDVTNSFLTPFQKMGEGMTQTLSRIYTDIVVVSTKFNLLGIDLGDTGLGLVTITEELISLNESSDKAGDGLKNLINVIDAFYNAVTTKGEKFDQSTKNLGSAIEAINANSLALAERSKMVTPKITVEELENGYDDVAANFQNNIQSVFNKLPEMTAVNINTDVNTLKGSELKDALETYTGQGKLTSAITDGFARVKALFPNVDEVGKLEALRPESFNAVVKTIGSAAKLSTITTEDLKSLGVMDKYTKNTTSTTAKKGTNEFYTALLKLAEDNSKKVIAKAAVNVDDFIKTNFANVLEIAPEYKDTLKEQLTAIFDSKDQSFIQNAFAVLSETVNGASSAIAGQIDATLKLEKTFTEVTNYLKESIAPVAENILSTFMTTGAYSARQDVQSLAGLSTGKDITSILDETSPILTGLVTEWLATLTDIQKANFGVTGSIKITEMALKSFSNELKKTEEFNKFTTAWQKVITITKEGVMVASEYDKRKVSNQDALDALGYNKLSADAVKVLNSATLEEISSNQKLLDVKTRLGVVDNNNLITSESLLGIKRQDLLNKAQDAANFKNDVDAAIYERQYTMATDAQKSILELEQKKKAIILKYGDETISGVEGTMKKSTALISLLVENTKKLDFSVALKSLNDFKKSIAEWAINLRITSLGSTKSQLDTAQLKLQYQIDAFKSTTGTATIDKSKITDNDVLANIEKYIALTEQGNVGKTVEEIKQGIMSGVTGDADQLIAAIKNFYGSSKEGIDMINGVIDMVTQLPQQVSDPQLRMVSLLEDIKKGIFQLPDALKGTALGQAIVSAQEVLSAVNSSSVLSSDVKSATSDSLAQAIYNSVGLILSKTTAQTVKDSGASVLTGATTDVLGIALSLQMTDAEKEIAIKGLTVAFKSYAVTIEALIEVPDSVSSVQLATSLKNIKDVLEGVAKDLGLTSSLTTIVELIKDLDSALTLVPDDVNTDVTLSGVDIEKMIGKDGLLTEYGKHFLELNKDVITKLNLTGVDIAKMIGEDGLLTNYGRGFLAISDTFTTNIDLTGADIPTTTANLNLFIEALDKIGTTFTTTITATQLTDTSDTSIANVTSIIKSNLEAIGKSFNLTVTDTGLSFTKTETQGIVDNLVLIGATTTINLDKSAVDTSINTTQGLIDALGTRLNGKVTIDTTDLDPATQLSAVDRLNSFINKLNADLKGEDKISGFKILVNKDSFTTEGALAGDKLVTAIKDKIDTLKNYSIPALNTSLAITSIYSVTQAAQSALDALKQIGAQKDAELARQAALAAEAAAKANQPSAGIITGGGSSSFSDNFGRETVSTPSVPDVMSKASFEALATNYGYSGDYTDIQAMINRIHFFAPNEHGRFYDDYGNIQQFANGGAFTNGIVSEPTMFNMGVMGEAGSEAIMPLANVGGKLGVIAANDSGNNEEELAELKKQNQILMAQNQILQAAFQEMIRQNEVANDKLDSIDSTTRKQVNG